MEDPEGRFSGPQKPYREEVSPRSKLKKTAQIQRRSLCIRIFRRKSSLGKPLTQLTLACTRGRRHGSTHLLIRLSIQLRTEARFQVLRQTRTMQIIHTTQVLSPDPFFP